MVRYKDSFFGNQCSCYIEKLLYLYLSQLLNKPDLDVHKLHIGFHCANDVAVAHCLALYAHTFSLCCKVYMVASNRTGLRMPVL